MMEIPKYKLIHDELLERLQNGHYAIGMRLPTESELSKSFGVSRITVRKALELLVRDGYLKSRQGSGYTVATASPPTSTCFVSYTDQVLREGRVPSARLLRLDAIAQDVPPDVEALFDEPLSLVERLRAVDGAPTMLTQTWIPHRLVPTISADHFPETGQNQSLLRILQRAFDLAWSSACETVDSLIAGPEIADLLQIPHGTAILTQACTAFDAEGGRVFYDMVYRKGPISFDLAGPAPRPTA